MKLGFDHVVTCPATAFWAVISDPARRKEWNASVRSLEVLTPGPPAVGTRWREQTWGLGSFTIEIVEYEPPRRFAEVTVDGRSDLWLALDLTPIEPARVWLRPLLRLTQEAPFAFLVIE